MRALRYGVQRLRAAVEARAVEAGSKSGTLQRVRQGVADAFSRPVSETRLFFGDSQMAPFLNSARCNSLLLRRLPLPSKRNVHVGDVVALAAPGPGAGELMLRRVTAAGRETLTSDDPEEEEFTLWQNQIWVECEDPSVNPSEARDSRWFGPVHLPNVLGRALYVMRDPTDHEAVDNNREAMEDDRVIIERELDIDALKNLWQRFQERQE